MLFLVVLLLLAHTHALRIAAAQFDSVADVKANTATICRLVAKAKSEGAEAVAFYEASVTSYNASFIASVPEQHLVAAIDRVKAACAKSKIHCVVGTPWFNSTGSRFNAALFINSDGKLVGVQHKMMLVGDDKSWALPGQSINTFPIHTDTQTVHCSIIICHDARFPELVRLPILRGSRLVFFISWEQSDYHPSFTKEDEDVYRAQVQSRAFENKIFLVHSNAPKNIDNPAIGSHGQSRIVSPSGAIIVEAPEVGEALVVEDLDFNLSTGSYAVEELTQGRLLRQWWADGMDAYVTAH